MQYNKYEYLLEGELLNEKEKKFYQSVSADMPSITATAALAQIEAKGYEKSLTTKGIAKERFRKYGFAFCGKQVLIGEGREQE